ncbi:MAG TPA: GatB/YqeY domain-containing protein [Burkholderiaceae bacterium]|jgi:uncharacterized protein YqeY|nr:GatB/YqeY domain-containing protein [Burkholderiaceae bacterium]
MNLKERIGEDMKGAMRAREAVRLSAIRMLLAAIKQKEVDERISVDDAQVVAIVDRLIRQRRDSIEQFEKAGRQELADREKLEIDVLSAYLPRQASAAEVAAEIDAAIAATGATGPQQMGKVMGVLKQRLAGRTDLSAVSAQVKARLGAG